MFQMIQNFITRGPSATRQCRTFGCWAAVQWHGIPGAHWLVGFLWIGPIFVPIDVYHGIDADPMHLLLQGHCFVSADGLYGYEI